MKKLLMGNEAIAYGAVEAGVQVVTGYPGTPSSEIFSTLVKMAPERGIYTEWSVNEKVALEVAAGAAYSGARAMVTMKQVGLNVASDPLMTLAYIGVKGGLVLVVADDPGPHSSQNEQDTRKFAQFAKLPVLDPSDPREAKQMVQEAFELSEKLRLPVILRPTTRVCHGCQDVEISEEKSVNSQSAGFQKGPEWVIFPSLAAKQHVWLNQQQEQARALFRSTSFNHKFLGTGQQGIICGGVSYRYVKEAMQLLGMNLPLLKIGTPYPLPANMVLEFVSGLERVLVVEELEPVLEEQVVQLLWQQRQALMVSGKQDRLVPREGELNVDKVRDALIRFLGMETPRIEQVSLPQLPVRPPVLCAGCPHRASFYVLKQAAGRNAIFTGDIGCYTLGNMAPLHAVDTCLCMGASITLGSGLQVTEKDKKVVAFIGDSTFFHTGIPGLINAVHNGSKVTVIVLDNRTTAMTGHQSHPGLHRNAIGTPVEPINIASLAAACGVKCVKVVDPLDVSNALQAAREALDYEGVSLIVMQRECVSLMKGSKGVRMIDKEKCLDCGICIEELGCPAISRGAESPIIGASCTGCDLCSQICPAGAIVERGVMR